MVYQRANSNTSPERTQGYPFAFSPSGTSVHFALQVALVCTIVHSFVCPLIKLGGLA